MSKGISPTSLANLAPPWPKGVSGNPAGRKVLPIHRFRDALHAAITDQDLADAAGVLVAVAKTGDVAAIALLLAYTIGKPAQAGPEAQAGLAEICRAEWARWARSPEQCDGEFRVARASREKGSVT